MSLPMFVLLPAGEGPSQGNAVLLPSSPGAALMAADGSCRSQALLLPVPSPGGHQDGSDSSVPLLFGMGCGLWALLCWLSTGIWAVAKAVLSLQEGQELSLSEHLQRDQLEFPWLGLCVMD